jgi:hypothetical protein
MLLEISSKEAKWDEMCLYFSLLVHHFERYIKLFITVYDCDS